MHWRKVHQYFSCSAKWRWGRAVATKKKRSAPRKEQMVWLSAAATTSPARRRCERHSDGRHAQRADMHAAQEIPLGEASGWEDADGERSLGGRSGRLPARSERRTLISGTTPRKRKRKNTISSHLHIAESLIRSLENKCWLRYSGGHDLRPPMACN